PHRLSAVAQPAHGQRLGGSRRDSSAAAMRVLRARRIVATAADGGDGEIHAQSRAHDSRYRAHDARRAQQSFQPSRRRRAGEQQTESLRDHHPAQCAGIGGTILRQAGAGLRSQMRRQRSLSAARDRNHSTREGIDSECAARGRHDRIGSAARRGVGRSGDMTMADDGRSRLGRGLAALMGDVSAEAPTTPERARTQRAVPLEHRRPNPRNPRRNFSDAELDELAASIRERGIIQPVVVRSVRGAKDAYEIIAGERRWRAAQRAALHEIPIVPFEATDSEALELAIIENVQRTDLNPLEEAGGYEALASEYGHSHEDIAKIVGKSRSHVTNTLRLLKLPEPVKAYI